jgi:hypothetical protein
VGADEGMGRSRGRTAAINMVFCALIAVAALVGVFTYVRHQNHVDACRKLRAALPAVLVVPVPRTSVDRASLAVLPPPDQKVLLASIATFRRQVSKELAKANAGCTAYGCTPTPFVPGAVRRPPETASSITTTDTPQWQSFASTFKQGVLENRGCQP